jgi:hypothetical protein
LKLAKFNYKKDARSWNFSGNVIFRLEMFVANRDYEIRGLTGRRF